MKNISSSTKYLPTNHQTKTNLCLRLIVLRMIFILLNDKGGYFKYSEDIISPK